MNDPAAYNSMRASLTELEGMLAKVRRGEGTLGRPDERSRPEQVD